MTRTDIERYVNANLQANDKFEALRQKDRVLCSELVAEIIGKAKGVWLWVILVVRSLLQGLRNKDTVSDLLVRLNRIPEELEQFSLQMFNTIDEFDRPKAVKLFRIAMEHQGPTLMTLSFLDDDSTTFQWPAPTRTILEEELQERLELTDSRLNIRCLGLLESVGSSQVQVQSPFRYPTVDFLHRTARDFLLSPDTQKVVGMESSASFNTNLFVCTSLLAQMNMLGFQ